AETSGSLPLTDFQKIQFQNVSFHYDATRGNILQDFNLTIEKGQWLGLIGKSGAGKSTVFDLLLRFYQAQAGHVTIDGVALEQFDLTTLRQKMTLVSQNINLFPGTIRDNLLLADPNADTARLNVVLAQVELQDFIASLPAGLETPVGEEGSLLSGGQKQRLSLAQGLLRHSPLLLLDEVSSALDPHTASAIKTMVATLKEKDQLTILSISHDYTFLDACDQVYRIVDGRAVPDIM
ncbi:ATP-binding cassette domain-containing protein, partial [Enterococcus nangangensis]